MPIKQGHFEMSAVPRLNEPFHQPFSLPRKRNKLQLVFLGAKRTCFSDRIRYASKFHRFRVFHLFSHDARVVSYDLNDSANEGKTQILSIQCIHYDNMAAFDKSANSKVPRHFRISPLCFGANCQQNVNNNGNNSHTNCATETFNIPHEMAVENFSIDCYVYVTSVQLCNISIIPCGTRDIRSSEFLVLNA